jgi:hypothetical protein
MSALLAPPLPWTAQGEHRQDSLFDPARPPTAPAEAPAEGERAEEPPAGGPTLDALVSGAWESLLAGAPAACPVCAATLEPPAEGLGEPGATGRCHACGSVLS